MLQYALNAISNWSDVWQLPIAVTKCACLVLNSVEKFCHNYMLCGQCLPFADSCVDLGIKVNSKLSSVQHISNFVSKAKERCSLILKCFLTNNVNTLVKAYTVYVRPLLEYNCAIWSPCFKKDINLIESVQRYFSRKVYSKLMLPDTCYNNRLLNLGLQRLETRRIIRDIVKTFKLCKGFSCLKMSAYVSLATYKSTRGHRYKLFVNRVHSRVHGHFLSNRIVNIWDVLPSCYFNTNIVSCFKSKLEQFNFSPYILGRT